MAERKVLIKYFPKNFDHQRIVKRGRGKDKLMMVRNMLPMSLRCNTCANYLYMGTKFNMRMEICNEQTYLGIKVFRFYFKFTFKTDPKNHDYLVETGGTRNYEVFKDALEAEKYLKRIKGNQKQENSMKYLQNRSYDSKREMDLMQALEDIKNLNKRQAVIDPEDLIKNLIYEEEEQQEFNQEQVQDVQKRWEQARAKLLEEKSVKLEDPLAIKQTDRQYNSISESQQQKKCTQAHLQNSPKTPAISNTQPKINKPEGCKIKLKESVISKMKKKIIKPDIGKKDSDKQQ